VRRPTGGRAVLHDDEVTYAVVARSGRPPFDGGVLDAYQVIAGALLAAFARLGITAALAGSERSGGVPRSGAVCFTEPSRHEIAAGPFKVAGSAQARRRGAFLQHGSIPISADASVLARATGTARGGAALPVVRGIAQILNRPIASHDLSDALRHGFEGVLGVRLVRDSLTPAEREHAEWLRAHRYLTTAWTFRR